MRLAGDVLMEVSLRELDAADGTVVMSLARLWHFKFALNSLKVSEWDRFTRVAVFILVLVIVALNAPLMARSDIVCVALYATFAVIVNQKLGAMRKSVGAIKARDKQKPVCEVALVHILVSELAIRQALHFELRDGQLTGGALPLSDVKLEEGLESFDAANAEAVAELARDIDVKAAVAPP